MKTCLVVVCVLLALAVAPACDLNHTELHHDHGFVSDRSPEAHNRAPAYWYECSYRHRLRYPNPIPPDSPCPYDETILRYIGYYQVGSEQ